MRHPVLLATSALALLSPTLSSAAETLSYTYDARGRLTQVANSGTVNDGIHSCYALDRADNRTSVIVGTTGCPSSPPPSGPSIRRTTFRRTKAATSSLRSA